MKDVCLCTKPQFASQKEWWREGQLICDITCPFCFDLGLTDGRLNSGSVLCSGSVIGFADSISLFLTNLRYCLYQIFQHSSLFPKQWRSCYLWCLEPRDIRFPLEMGCPSLQSLRIATWHRSQMLLGILDAVHVDGAGCLFWCDLVVSSSNSVIILATSGPATPNGSNIQQHEDFQWKCFEPKVKLNTCTHKYPWS